MRCSETAGHVRRWDRPACLSTGDGALYLGPKEHPEPHSFTTTKEPKRPVSPDETVFRPYSSPLRGWRTYVLKDVTGSPTVTAAEGALAASSPAGLARVEVRGCDWSYLRSRHRATLMPEAGDAIRVVDLFSGVGGLTLGAVEAAASLGKSIDVRFAGDSDPAATRCYRRNFSGANAICADLRSVFTENLNKRLSKAEQDLRSQVGNLDLLLGGPPCQGHSDLNNYSRRDDPKNHLYAIMGRAAAVLDPRVVVIENVPGARHDRSGSVRTTVEQLDTLGYTVATHVVNAVDLGVPQSRKRLLVVAYKEGTFDLEAVIKNYQLSTRSVRWAISDIEYDEQVGLMSQPASSSADTKRRIDFLFDNNLLDLPNEQRPPCHRNRNHSYMSVYGRLSWDKPAQTVTRGFYSMCMGRYVHPSQRRTLTAREAARLQFFPDFFDFSEAKNRTAIATLIGNAVPPKLIYPFVRELFLR